MFFRVLGDHKAYFVYRFRINRRERDMSLGPYPELGLGEARKKHADLRARVLNGAEFPDFWLTQPSCLRRFAPSPLSDSRTA